MNEAEKIGIRIKLIAGMEPKREGEWPTTFAVGNSFHGPNKHTITRIESRNENLGTYGITWFDIFDGDDLLVSMNAMAVSEIHYDADHTTADRGGGEGCDIAAERGRLAGLREARAITDATERKADAPTKEPWFEVACGISTAIAARIAEIEGTSK